MEEYVVYTFGLIFMGGATLFSQVLKNKKLFTCISCGFVLSFILAVRSPQSFNIDCFRYYKEYTEMSMYDFSYVFGIRENMSNVLFFIIFWTFSNLGIPYQVFLFFYSAFCLIVISYMIYKYSEKPLLSYIMYLGFGLYTYCFYLFKQMIAITFILLCFDQLQKSKKRKALIFLILASLCHPTAIIFLPVMFADRIVKVNKQFVVLSVLAFAFVFIFRLKIAELLMRTFNEEYIGVYNVTSKIGGTAIVLLFLLALLFYSTDFLESNYNNVLLKSYFYIAITSVLVQFLSSYAYAYSRLNLYYLQFSIFILPYSLDTPKMVKSCGKYFYILKIVLYAFLTYFMIIQFYQHLKFDCTYGYEFFWE